MADTVQLSDEYLLEKTKSTVPDRKISRGKSVIVVPDLNQGSYNSGLINIDSSTSLTGSKGFASLSEAYLTVPFIITAKNSGSTEHEQPLKRFLCSLKSNYATIISDLTVELGGKQIISPVEYKEHWNTLRTMTETCFDELQKHDTDRGLFLDSWYSIGWSKKKATAWGDGYFNNSYNASAEFDGTVEQTQQNLMSNRAMGERFDNALPVIDSSTDDAFGWGSLAKGGALGIAKQHGRGGFVEFVRKVDPTPPATETLLKGPLAGQVGGIWVYMLKIRLVDLHPVFKELDLIANPQLKLSYRVSSGTVDVYAERGDGDPPQMNLHSATMTSGNICPVIISSGEKGQGMGNLVTRLGNDSVALSWGCLQNEFSTVSDIAPYVPYTTTRLHVPFYDIIDARPLIEKPLKTVHFLDCYSRYVKDQGGSGVSDGQLNEDFSITLGVNKKNIKYVAVIPYADTSKDYWYNTALRAEQFQSPFDTAPWTFMPGASIRNFQVQIGSQNVFTKTHSYDWETFMDEFAKLSAVNGDNSHDIGTGIINSNQWSYCQRVMIADCSRYTEKDVPQSVTITGTNSCTQGMNLLVLVVYQREMTYNLITGEVEHTTA